MPCRLPVLLKALLRLLWDVHTERGPTPEPVRAALLHGATQCLILLDCCCQGQVKQTCAVCLEDFRLREELGVLPCQHAFHRGCLLKWLEVRCVCPMCNKALEGPGQPRAGIGTLLDELV